MLSDEVKLSAEILSALNNAETGDSIIKSIDYTRPLNEYPTVQKIVEYLKLDIPAQHVYTESLNLYGKVVQDDMEKYLENDALSSSMLKAASKTPLDFQFSLSEDKEALEELRGKKHFALGTFLHQCLLEPTKFKRAIIEPDFKLSSHEGCDVGIAFYEGLCAERGIVFPNVPVESLQTKKNYIEALKKLADVEAVEPEHKLKIDILEKRINTYAGGIIKRLLLHSKRETSVYYTDPETDMPLKVRPDAIQFRENIGVDAIISVKSTACESLDAFYSHAAKLNYDLSEGMYQEVVSAATGRDFNTTIMIMLQTVAPYHIAVLVWTPEDIEMGKYKFRNALHNAKQIIEKGSAQGLEVHAQDDSFGLIEMALPGWNQKEQLPVNIKNHYGK